MEESYPHRQYQTRNILTMAQRMKVIKAYDRTPNYQRLGRMFGCSAKQIKNILAHKHELLNHYKTVRDSKLADEAANRRQEKINFLGKVVYEFLLRSLYLRIPVGTAIIRQKAFEVKEAIAIENFAPNQAWFNDFRSTYNRLDLTNILENLPNDMNMRRSLRSIDLIDYVSKQQKEQSSKKQSMSENEKFKAVWGECFDSYNTKQSSTEKYIEESRDEYFNIYEDNSNMANKVMKEHDEVERSNSNEINNVPLEVKLELDDMYYNKESSEADSLRKTKEQKAHTNVSKSISSPTKVAAQPPPAPPTLPDIHSYLEALSHLKVLEDFAMIEENYRAIGLITQLEQIFKNPPKLKRI
ncbi:uncharacterized protein [Eurosta solidaginis]|uniref:uncharacterized protein n=1 Tax=Eurosta solidaginis TaxID=178769 RepID=UPI003530AF1F